MIQLHSDHDVREHCHAAVAPLILVPTMGALHPGHFSLIAKAKTLAGDYGKVIVTIFVNPIQFDRSQDLDTYPRPIEQDLAHCERLGVDYVFTPDPDTFYLEDRSIKVSETDLSKLLCGATRPGHFNGVCTVITKFFNLLQPTAAIFGEKDYQQLAIIRRLVRDLSYQIEIIGYPTVREISGLALSSRNAKLTADRILSKFRLHLDKAAPLSSIDYLECVDAENLQALKELDRPAIIATAVFFGQIRLIDNIVL